MSRKLSDPTAFLNVDLEIVARRDLQPLVDAAARWAFPLHVRRSGRQHRAHLAHFESTLQARSAETTIRRLLDGIERLPASAARLWRTATRRTFNVGVQAGLTPHAADFTLSPTLLVRVAAQGASVTFTVYAPDSDSYTTTRRRPGTGRS